MTAKEFLRQYIDAEMRIKSLSADIDRLESVLTSGAIRYDKERVQSSGTLDRDRIIAEIADKQLELERMREDAALTMCEVSAVIRKVEPAEQARLLHLRYIEDKRWQDIADELHYTYRWTTSLHGEALKKVGEIVKSSY